MSEIDESESEKCFCMRLELGCLLVGILHLIISAAVFATSVAFLAIAVDTTEVKSLSTPPHHDGNFHLNKTSVDIVEKTALAFSLISMIFCILFIVGIKMRKAGLVLSYFSFGVLMTIVCQLSALLVMLQGCWRLALVLFTSSLAYIRCLMLIRSLYEVLQSEKTSGFSPDQSSDVEVLISN